MASRNADAVSSQGEFHASKPRDEPLTTHGVSHYKNNLTKRQPRN